MTDHPDRETLKRFIAGELPSGEARQADQHLSFCSDCRDRADEITTRQTLRLLDACLSPGYDEAFDRAAERVAERLAGFAEDPLSTDSALADLLRERPSGRRHRIFDEERFQSLKLAQLLQSRSREAWTSSPASALEMADLAVEVTQYLDSGRYGSCVVEDARANAWSYLGNAFRIGSDYRRAEQALEQAWAHHTLAGEDAYTEAQLLSFTASLRRNQSRYQEALQLSDKAIGLYREGQDSHLEASALIVKGLILGQEGRHKRAIPVLLAGLRRIDSQRDPRLHSSATQNLVRCLAESGAPLLAQTLMEQNRHLYDTLGSAGLARAQWLEGYIANESGHFSEARTTFHEVRERFLDLQMGTEFFFVSLELAESYFRSRKQREAKAVLGEVLPLGEALGLDKGILMARLLYEKTSRR